MRASVRKALLISASFDSIVNAWFTTWWAVSFLHLLAQATISTRTIVGAISGVIVSLVIVKHIQIPPVWLILLLDGIAYGNLALLWVSTDLFYIFGGLFTAIIGTVNSTLNSAILAQNIADPLDRVSYDNKYALIVTVGSIVGGLLSMGFLLEHTDIKILWVALYILWDLDLFLRVYLISTRRLIYNPTF